MTISSPVLGRIQLLDRPFASPGKCAVCGSVTRPVIDFNFNLDWYGAVYFCVECMADAGRVIGLVPIEEMSALVQENLSTVISYCSANNLVVIPKEQYDAARSIVSALTSSFNDFSSIFPVPMERISESENATSGDNSAVNAESDHDNRADSTTALESISDAGDERPASFSSSAVDSLTFD